MTTPAMAGQLVPDEVWDAIQPLLPAKPPHPKGGRPWIEDRAVLGGIIDVLRAGIPWRLLPAKELGCGGGVTCWRRLRDWQQAGVWEALHHRLRRAVGCLDVAICTNLVDHGRVNIFERWSRRRRWRASAAAALTRNSARRCSRCPFRSTTSPTCGPCSGRRQSELAARSHARRMSSAPRCGQTRKTTTRERTSP